MYYLINNIGDYQELPYAKTKDDAEFILQMRYNEDEIAEYEWEVINDEDREV